MLMPQFSTRSLLLATVGVALAFLIISYAFRGNPLAAAFSGILFAIVVTLAIYAVMFGLVMTVSSMWSGRASRSGSASPFAATKARSEMVGAATGESQSPIDAELAE